MVRRAKFAQRITPKARGDRRETQQVRPILAPARRHLHRRHDDHAARRAQRDQLAVMLQLSWSVIAATRKLVLREVIQQLLGTPRTVAVDGVHLQVDGVIG